MNCLWDDVPNSTDHRGWRRVRCVREGCGVVSNPTPHEHHAIFCACRALRPKAGAGDELHKLLSSLNINPDKCGGACDEMMRRMNEWGVECASHRQEIIDHLKLAYSRTNWTVVLAAGVLLLAESWFDPLDPFGSIVDEAMRRSARKPE